MRYNKSIWIFLVAFLIAMTIFKAFECDYCPIEFSQTIVSKDQTDQKQQMIEKDDSKTKTYDDEDLNRIIDAAKTIPQGPVMVSLVNDAFIPFVFSWLCNTKNMGIHQQVLLITTDIDSKTKVNSLWPDIKIVVISVDKSMHGAQKYSHAGYVRLVIRRTQILMALLENDIETFMFEVDCLWIRNSVPLLHSHAGQYDIVFNGVFNQEQLINGGFLYLFPTKPTKDVFAELNKMLLRLDLKLQKLPPGKPISEAENDQVYLSKLVFKKFAGIKIKIFSMAEFGDGKWYSLSQKVKDKSNPYLINFNWIIGNSNKIARAKKWGHWFIKEDNSCDTEQVSKIVDKWAAEHKTIVYFLS